jgi:hypothetical protein
MPDSELPAHLLLHVLPDIAPCWRCGEPIRLARKLRRHNPRNAWCPVPAAVQPGTTQLPVTTVHACDAYTRRSALRSLPTVSHG